MILYMIDNYYCTLCIYRSACAIADPAGTSVVLTGGSYFISGHGVPGTPGKTVSRYDRSGWMEDLPNMTVGRFRHGCAGFMKDGEMVSRYL